MIIKASLFSYLKRDKTIKNLDNVSRIARGVDGVKCWMIFYIESQDYKYHKEWDW